MLNTVAKDVEKNNSLIWFRNDLRTQDHSGLFHALKNSKNMVTETLGLITSRALSSNLYDLDQSAIFMTRWFRTLVGKQNSLFLNHSGLSASSFSTSETLEDS